MGYLYSYIGVGLSALLVSTYWAMRRPSEREASISLAPRFFILECMNFVNKESVDCVC